MEQIIPSTKFNNWSVVLAFFITVSQSILILFCRYRYSPEYNSLLCCCGLFTGLLDSYQQIASYIPHVLWHCKVLLVSFNTWHFFLSSQHGVKMAEHIVFLLLIWKYACQESTHQHTQYLGFHKLHLPTPMLWCFTCQPQPDGVLAGWFLIIRFYLTSWIRLCQGKHRPLFLPTRWLLTWQSAAVENLCYQLSDVLNKNDPIAMPYLRSLQSWCWGGKSWDNIISPWACYYRSMIS